MSPFRSASIVSRLGIGLALIVLAGAVVAWMFTPVTFVADANQQREFVLDCDYRQFRKILVRKNATRAIVENGGMELIDQKLGGLTLDLRDDRRPIRNAIRGQSQAQLAASRTLKVRLTDPQIHAEQMELIQHADVENQSLTVSTEASQATGNLKQYQTNLLAKGQKDQTEVKLSVQMKVQLDIPRLFVSRARDQVQQAASDGLRQQEAALKKLVEQYGDQKLLIPDLD